MTGADAQVHAAVDGLIRAYGAAVDARDAAAVVDCFTEDAHLEYFGGAVVLDGIDAVRAFFDFARPGGLPGLDHVRSSIHLWQLDQVRVDADGAGAESVTSCIAYVCGLPDDGGGPVLVTRGIRYVDRAVLDGDGRWRLSRRRHAPLWETRGPAIVPNAPGPVEVPR